MSYSFESKIIKEALREFGWTDDVMSRRDKYKRVADLMNYRPLGKDGKLLTIGGVGYKKLVMNELVRRFGFVREEARIRRAREQIQENQQRINRQIRNRERRPYYANKRLINFQRTHSIYSYDIEGANNLQQLYEAIESIIRNERDIEYITIFFKATFDNKIRGLTLDIKEITDLDDFENIVNQHINGEIAGSDAYAESDYELLTDIVNTSRIYRKNIANGKPDKILFKCVGINSKKNECGAECFKKSWL